MTAVVLIAVMVDRRAVTFRTLAVAAMIVLGLVRRTRSGFFVDAVKPRGMNRPWAPAAEGEGETEPATPTAHPTTAPRAVDATPSDADLQAED
jgi:competence protein ComEC